MNKNREDILKAFGDLLDVVEELRQKCPWDRKQTNESLRCNTIEEVYELSSALLDNDMLNIKKELGDVLLHVLFYSTIAKEKRQFDIADVCDSLRAKLIFRHPHIYGDVQADSATEVIQNWEQIKLKEKGGNKRVLDGVPSALPSLIKAERIQEKAANYGFDWKDKVDVWQKVREEVLEFAEEMESGSDKSRTDEFGDVLFSLINAARLYKINVDNALESTNRKFINRFNYIEDTADRQGLKLKDMSLEQMDNLWNEAKKLEKDNRNE